MTIISLICSAMFLSFLFNNLILMEKNISGQKSAKSFRKMLETQSLNLQNLQKNISYWICYVSIIQRVSIIVTVNIFCSSTGGTMLEGFSPSAPEFHCHHGFVDKIWADWQKKSSANLNAHFLGIKGKMTATNYYPRDLINLTRQPGCVRVCYDDPTVNNGRRVKSFLKSVFFIFIFLLRQFIGIMSKK